MNYLCMDVGTTCCKCQLFTKNGEILEYIAEEYDFLQKDGHNYIDIEKIWRCLKAMIAKIAKKHEINSFCVSSLGESFVLLDKQDRLLFPPMLYTDGRGEAEAEEIKEKIGEERAFLTTGVIPHSMYSISKLLWIKNNHPEIYESADKLLLVGEYVGYLLSGKRVIDYSLASRSGVFDIEKLKFSGEILTELDIPFGLFSKPMPTGSIVGPIKKELIDGLGIKGEPVLVLGSHDQICASLGAGLLSAGDAVDGMGTVECITTLFSEKSDNVKMGRQGYPCVPYAIEGLYCTYIFNYSCGSTVNWYRKKITHGYSGKEKNFFDYMEKNISESHTDLLLLPYFGGAATPYQDISARGAVIGLTTETTDAEIYRAILEGTAMEMRFNAEVVKEYGITPKSLVATGGGSNSRKWMQIKADIQNLPIRVLRSSEGGLCGCAMLSAVALGGSADLREAKDVFVIYTDEFLPNALSHESYAENYQKYKKLYKAVKEITQ